MAMMEHANAQAKTHIHRPSLWHVSQHSQISQQTNMHISRVDHLSSPSLIQITHHPIIPSSPFIFHLQRPSSPLNSSVLPLKPNNVNTVNGNSFYNNVPPIVLLRHGGALMCRFSG